MEEEDLAEAIGQLHEDGALDDERFALRYAEDKRELSGWGPERIREALRERGLPGPLIESAISAETREEQLARALLLLSTKDYDLDDPDQKRKALGALARRGFDSEVAYDALREQARERRDSGTTG